MDGMGYPNVRVNGSSTEPNSGIYASYPAACHSLLGIPHTSLGPPEHCHILEPLLERQGAASFVQRHGDPSSAEDSRRSTGAQGQRNLLVSCHGWNQPFGNFLDHISTNQREHIPMV